MWRAGPDRVKDGVEKLAALGGGESGLCGLPGLRGEARGGECFERALRLSGEDAAPPSTLPGGKGIWLVSAKRW